MIEPASVFCIGVYFLGVGVVSSVLYIPISLMRAIEHYHIGRDVRRINDNGNNEYFSEDEIVGASSIMNTNPKKEEPFSYDSGTNSQDKLELLIYKKKLLRDILNGNNYLTNLNLDDKSDVYSIGCCSDSDSNRKLPMQNDCVMSHNDVFNASTFKELTSSTSSSSVITSTDDSNSNTSTVTLFDAYEGEVSVLVDNDDSIFHLNYFNNINIIKESGKPKHSGSSSTCSLISSLETSSTVNKEANKYTNGEDYIVNYDNDVSCYRNQQYLDISENKSVHGGGNNSLNSHKVMREQQFLLNDVMMSPDNVITEISEACDVLAL